MKKLITLCSFATITFLSSCGGVREWSTKYHKESNLTEEELKSATFMPSCDVDFEGPVFKKGFVENGTVVIATLKDRLLVAGSHGKAGEFGRGNDGREIISYLVHYMVGSYEYIVRYIKGDNGKFTLDTGLNRTYVIYKGESYKITAKPLEECRMLFNLKRTTEEGSQE